MSDRGAGVIVPGSPSSIPRAARALGFEHGRMWAAAAAYTCIRRGWCVAATLPHQRVSFRCKAGMPAAGLAGAGIACRRTG